MQHFARLLPLLALAAATARAQDPATLVDRSYPVLQQIRVSLQFASAAPAAFRELGLEDVLGDSLLPEEWSALRARLAAHPGVELRDCPTMLARRGTIDTAKGVSEVIYPTEFDVEPFRGDDGKTGVRVEPEDFRTREVGFIVQVTPGVSPTEQWLTLDLTPVTVFPPSWRDFAGPGSPAAGAFVQPFFPVFSLATSVDLRDGRTLVFGGVVVDEPDKGSRVQLLFVSAERVLLDGGPLPLAIPAEEPPPPGFETRRFAILRGVGDLALRAGADPASATNVVLALRELAGHAGVDWPEGSFVRFDRIDWTAVVRNTPENLDRFRRALVRARLVPFHFQCRVRTRFLSATPDAFEALSLSEKLGGSFSPDDWAALRAKLDATPGVETRAWPTLLAQTGITATIKGVTEFVYPTEYEVKNTLSVARSVLRVQAALRPFPDADSEYLYTPEDGGQLVPFENGILNTSSMELLPFTPHLFVTGYIHTEYRPDIEKCDQTDTILKGIIPAQETLDFFYEMVGYILFERDMYPPALFNIYGPGKTGKSTLAETIAAILGKENIAKMGINQLTAQFSTAELDGKQLNICGETGGASAKETRFDGELIKRLSEGDEVMVEKKHKDPFYIKNMAKFLFVTNSIPDFGDASSGLYRRLYVVPCRIEQTEPDLKRKLTTPESKSWILNRALAAYNLFVKNGKEFTISPQMKLELTQYMTQDSVLDFLIATFNTPDRYQIASKIANDDEYCYSTNLYEAYVEYTRHALSQPLSRKKFVERIRNEYCLRTKTVQWIVNDRTTTRTRYVL